MKFIKLLLVSMALGHAARPFFLTENATKVAVVCIMIWFVMTAVREAEKEKPIHPATARLLSPLRHKYVMPAASIYGMSWVYAHTTLSRFLVDILRG
ncbi:MAG: hypothetical protein NUW21_12885 [Elusimicrobia bacterium]|nr:hypothetical protein [Elusimicrobiota bacterium]